MAKYQVTDDTAVTLNANNLFDKHYYTRYGFYAGRSTATRATWR